MSGPASKLGTVPGITPQPPYPWPRSSATGVGSMPGADPAEAMRVILGELPDLPHLAELPARGPGAELAGRTAALLVDLPVEITPGGWRFTGRPGRDLGRARDLLAADLDALAETAGGYTGPLKIQICGPWTLAAAIELARSQDPALADPGAVADLTESLAEGTRAHLAEVSKRVPGGQLLLQLDEPSLPAVLAGQVPTASGLNRLPVPEDTEAEAGLAAIISTARAVTLVHCCARQVPFGIIRGAGADAVGCDLSQLGRAAEDELAEAVEAGLGIFAGVAAPAGAAPPPARELAGRVTGLWQRLGWPVARGGSEPGRQGVPDQVVLTPGCGLAGATAGYARAVLARCREAAALLPELIEEEP
jgi:hypothetical protein